MPVRLTAVVTAAMGWSIAPLPAVADHEAIAERARVIVAQDIYQKELVKSPHEPSRVPRLSLKSGGEPRNPPSDAAARIILYLAIGLASGLVLVWLIGWLVRRRQSNTSTDGETHPAGKAPVETLTSLRSVESLANSGDHGAAVRGLLHLAVSFLSSERQLEPSPASTGRELERLLPRNREEKATLSLLVETVERSFFGGMSVDPQAYERCREAFARMLT
jgi:hypothetical protein